MIGASRRAVAVAALAVLALCAVTPASALTLQVEPQSEECFYEGLTYADSFNMEFEVIRGGLLDIQLRVYAPNNRVILERMVYFSRRTDDGPQATDEEEGKVQFVAPADGVHKICFDNQMSRWTAKVVTITMPDESRKHSEDIAKLEHLGPVVDSVIKISDDLEVIEKLQHQARVRDQVARDVADSMNSRVQYLAFVESALLVAISVFQLHYIRRWFADSEKMGRV